MQRSGRRSGCVPILMVCAACNGSEVNTSAFRSGEGVERQTVQEEAQPEQGEDVVGYHDAPETPLAPRDDVPETICDDMGPVDRPVTLAWSDAPNADSIAVLEDGVAWLGVTNTTEQAIDVTATIIVSNGSESIQHAGEEEVALPANEATPIEIDLAELQIANPSVRNSENVLVRLDFANPSGSGLSQAFSTTLYFHEEDDEITAYGGDALREQFNGGDIFGLIDHNALAEVVDIPPSVIVGVFISEG